MLAEGFVAGLVKYLLVCSVINNRKLNKAVDDYGVSWISKERDTRKGKETQGNSWRLLRKSSQRC